MHSYGNAFLVEGGEVKAVGESSLVTNARIGIHGAYAKVGENSDGTALMGRETVYYQASAWGELAVRLASLNNGDNFEFSGRVRASKPYVVEGVTKYPDNTLELNTIDFQPSRQRSRSANVEGTNPQAGADDAGERVDTAQRLSGGSAEPPAAVETSRTGDEVEIGF